MIIKSIRFQPFLLLTLLCISLEISAQYPTPEFAEQNPRHTETYWQTKDITAQKRDWNNGNTQIEYEQLNDSIRLRKEYYHSGNLKLTVEVYQHWQHDTMYTENLLTGEMTMLIKEGYADVLHGKYAEYKDHKGIPAYSTGSYFQNAKAGEWTKRERDAYIVATFNTPNELDGPYFEYYKNYADPRASVKWKGQYSITTYTQVKEDLLTGELREFEIRKSVRSGTWQYFDQGGELLQTVTYEWKK